MDTITERLRSKYGERMTLAECSKELRIPYETLLQYRVRGIMPIKTHKDGRRVYGMTDDVAKHLEGFLS